MNGSWKAELARQVPGLLVLALLVWFGLQEMSALVQDSNYLAGRVVGVLERLEEKLGEICLMPDGHAGR